MKPKWLWVLILLVLPAQHLLAAAYVLLPANNAESHNAEPVQITLAADSVPNSILQAGDGPWFDLEFPEVAENSGTGFDHPQLGADRREIARLVMERISRILDDETGSARIRLDSRSPWLNGQTLAVGVPYFRCIDGFEKPIIFDALRTDTHVHDIEGELLVNFDLPVSASLEAPPAGQYDLYTLLFHEAVHILGFVGFSVEADGRPSDCGGARMLPAVAQYATDGFGQPLWIEQDGKIQYAGAANELPGQQPALTLDPNLQPESSLRLATGALSVSGHWLPEDFEDRSGVLMLKEPFPTGQTRRNLTPEAKTILETVLEYKVSQEVRGLTGSWVDPDRDGQGFTLHFISEQRFAIYFFGFGADGERLWLVGLHNGPIKLGASLSLPMFSATGGHFNLLQHGPVTEEIWGLLNIRFKDCNAAAATLSGTDGTEPMQLLPLARLNNLDCY